MFFDLFGALCSLLSTYFFIRLNKNAWLVGLLATCINGWLYWQKGIYADMVLEAVYFVSMGYGWYLWSTGQAHTSNKQLIRYHLSLKQWLILATTLVTVFCLIYAFLRTYTHSTVPILDATTTSLSLVAQWLMCHKIIITWFLWFITDALYAFLYWHKSLPFHALLMIVYTGMAITGYMVWAKQFRAEKNTIPSSAEPVSVS